MTVRGRQKSPLPKKPWTLGRVYRTRRRFFEAFVDFDFEASIIAARGRGGQLVAYDPPQNVHEKHILRRSTVPSKMSAAQIAQARSIARKIADALDYVGVLAVELFVTSDGTLLINEVAPRVHNSGHWTIDACLVSQFEQHIRAIAGSPRAGFARAPCRRHHGEYRRY